MFAYEKAGEAHCMYLFIFKEILIMIFPFISHSVVQFVLNLGQTQVHTDSPHLAVDICLEEGKYI